MTPSTKGPWFVWEPERTCDHPWSGKADHILIAASTDPNDVLQEVARVCCRSYYFEGQEEVEVESHLTRATAPVEAIANARLIAAAPALLRWAELVGNLLEDGRAHSAGEHDEPLMPGDFTEFIETLETILSMVKGREVAA